VTATENGIVDVTQGFSPFVISYELKESETNAGSNSENATAANTGSGSENATAANAGSNSENATVANTASNSENATKTNAGSGSENTADGVKTGDTANPAPYAVMLGAAMLLAYAVSKKRAKNN
jgi:cobalamin biosynthesis Mg chelatase CobN